MPVVNMWLKFHRHQTRRSLSQLGLKITAHAKKSVKEESKLVQLEYRVAIITRINGGSVSHQKRITKQSLLLRLLVITL